MSNPCILEICVETVEHAAAAERGGADRVELCSDLVSGGVTPPSSLIQVARKQLQIPIHVMIRPRAGNFCYSASELATMRQQILAAKAAGMDGVVLGLLQSSGKVDLDRTAELVELAHPLMVTFHRAFDATQDLAQALEDTIATGAQRILTSGGQRRAIDALPLLAELVQAAKARISLMICGGINPQNIEQVIRSTSAPEVHSSVGTSKTHAHSAEWHDSESGVNLTIESFQGRVASLVRILRAKKDEQPDLTT
jgi:copper homeostasis protein